MTKTSAAAVANEFLKLQESDNSSFPVIDQMKLQKLVYYAHAWWLAVHGHPLFDDDIEAWPWGPVVRDIYFQFSDCKRNPVGSKRAVVFSKMPDGTFTFIKPPEPENEVKKFLASVWASHKHMTGIQLSNATHGPGEPWTIIKNQYGSLDEKPRIPNELIMDIFKRKCA